MYGLVPVRFPKLFNRLLENVFGWEAFPAKSGKEENSIEKETNASNGTPAFAGVDAPTEIVEGCLGGPTATERAAQRDVQASHTRRCNRRHIVGM